MSGALAQVGDARPLARLVRIITKPRADGATLALASYRQAEAEKAMDDLRAGVRSCKTFSVDPTFRYERITALPDPGTGDESVSFSFDQVLVGPKEIRVPMTYVVVRSGTTVVNVSAMNIEGNGRPATVPPTLVDAQLRKLVG
ncbi:hypothetical protein ACFO9E_26540 [Streptomyces maoxianensis]|uniref:Uncharacterized protein n=1 Tax=Streptomyces maoxianensis TaxID=1459942 RepID=A0ABV9GAJ9_9ACTN